MKKNICIIGLATNFTKAVSKLLSDKLEMFYADVNDLLKFDLLDLKEAQKLSGKDYILKQETGKIKTVATYENTVITISYHSLIQNNNYELFQPNTLIIYAQLTPELYELAIKQDKLTKSQKTIAATVFPDRDKFCKKISNLTVKLKNLKTEEQVETLIKAIKKYYEV